MGCESRIWARTEWCGSGERVKNGWDIKSGGQDRGRRVMGYAEGERAGNPKCCYILGVVWKREPGGTG